jgi:hypothetical protein
MKPCTVSDKYEAGLWVPSYYGSRFCLANKTIKTEMSEPERTIGGRVYEARIWMSELDTTRIFDTLAEAQAAADQRNWELSR